MKLTGVVRREDLGPGVFILDANGTQYVIAGGDRALRKDGQRVEVEGEVDPNAATTAGKGPVFRVTSYKIL